MSGSANSKAPLIVVCANLAWNLVNFRGALISDLIAAGYRILAVAPPDPAMETRLAALGCDFAPVAIDSMGLSGLRDMRTAAAFVAIIRKHRPVAWLSWTIKPNVYGALAARLTGIPAFPNVSGLGTAFIRRNLLTAIVRQLYRFGFARASAVFFQNPNDRDLFLKGSLVRPNQAELLPGSGIDLEHWRPIGMQRTARLRFLMLARVVADKGVREFVEAARLLKRDWPDARFVLMGFLDVANRTAISAQEVQGWVDEGIVEYRPPVEDPRQEIADADFVVLPSYREGLSRVLLEAAAMGRPAIATDVPGCREIVNDGENGFLCRPGDALSLAKAMDRAARVNDIEWRRMGQNGRNLAIAEFSHLRVNALYIEALRKHGVTP